MAALDMAGYANPFEAMRDLDYMESVDGAPETELQSRPRSWLREVAEVLEALK